MQKQVAYLGLDVHKNSITLAIFVGNSEREEFTQHHPAPLYNKVVLG